MNAQKGKVFFVMGVSGSGKTTVGKLLAEKLEFPFFDGDDFHPEANIIKMSAGEPLNDEDRLPWLVRLGQVAQEHGIPGCVIACSALKAKYRTTLTGGLTHEVHWVFLDGDYETIIARMKERKDHFMPAALLRSQMETLEAPVNAIRIPIAGTPEQQVEQIINFWKSKRKSGL